MPYCMSMQTICFRSANDYEQFKMLLANVAEHLRKIEGFVHFTWWVHPVSAPKACAALPFSLVAGFVTTWLNEKIAFFLSILCPPSNHSGIPTSLD
jgi:hypothetical protein